MISLYAILLYLPIMYLFLKYFVYYYHKDKNGKEKVSNLYFITYIIGVAILLLPYLLVWSVIGTQLSYCNNAIIDGTGTALLMGAYVMLVCDLVFVFFTILIWIVLGISWMITSKD